MINEKCLIEKFNLTEKQAQDVLNIIENEIYFRGLLMDEGIPTYFIADRIARVTDYEDICCADEEDLLRDKIRYEWREFIPKEKR